MSTESKAKELRSKNEALTTELHFELLKHYAWLSSASIGGIVVIVEIKAIEISSDTWMSVGFLALSIFVSLVGKDLIIDTLLKGKTIYDITKYLKLIRYMVMFSFGLGFGKFLNGFFG